MPGREVAGFGSCHCGPRCHHIHPGDREGQHRGQVAATLPTAQATAPNGVSCDTCVPFNILTLNAPHWRPRPSTPSSTTTLWSQPPVAQVSQPPDLAFSPLPHPPPALFLLCQPLPRGMLLSGFFTRAPSPRLRSFPTISVPATLTKATYLQPKSCISCSQSYLSCSDPHCLCSCPPLEEV